MSGVTYEISGDKICFSNSQIVQFTSPVAKIVRKADILMVYTLAAQGTTNGNVLSGVDLSGNILWQIEPQHPNTVADVTYEISGNEIRFNNGRIVRFEHPVFRIVQFGNILVVGIWPPRGTTYNENIFGVDISGNKLWQIEPQYPSTVANAAFDVEGEDGLAVVSNIKDLVLHLEPATGKVVKKYYQMH